MKIFIVILLLVAIWVVLSLIFPPKPYSPPWADEKESNAIGAFAGKNNPTGIKGGVFIGTSENKNIPSGRPIKLPDKKEPGKRVTGEDHVIFGPRGLSREWLDNAVVGYEAKKIEPLGRPDMSDFDNRTGSYVDYSPNTYQEQYDARTISNMAEKINEIVEWINSQEE